MDWLQSEVVGAVVGAVLGAILGALAGAVVSRWSIRYDRRQGACAAMQACADEARFNAQVVRHLQEDPRDVTPSALEREAMDAALPFLSVLPPDLRTRARDVRARILILMHIEEILEAEAARPGAIPATTTRKRQTLIDALPADLDSIANDIEMFVQTDCKSAWLF